MRCTANSQPSEQNEITAPISWIRNDKREKRTKKSIAFAGSLPSKVMELDSGCRSGMTITIVVNEQHDPVNQQEWV